MSRGVKTKTDEMNWLEDAEIKLQEQRIVNGICKATIEATIAFMEANPPEFHDMTNSMTRIRRELEYSTTLERLRATFDLLA